MSTIVEATVPAGQFGLEETLDRLPEAEFRMVRLVAHGSNSVMPFIWVSCDDPDRLADVVSRDSSIADVDVLGRFDSECLLRVHWQPTVRVFVSIVDDHEATILDASGQDGVWQLQIFFPDDDHVSSTFEFCEAYGIDIDFERIDQLSGTSEYGHLGLTECQYQTLLGAYGAGYYDVPRNVTQEQLAQRFDVSHQALSERLRRAHETILTNALNHEIHRRDNAVSPRMSPRVDT